MNIDLSIILKVYFLLGLIFGISIMTFTFSIIEVLKKNKLKRLFKNNYDKKILYSYNILKENKNK